MCLIGKFEMAGVEITTTIFHILREQIFSTYLTNFCGKPRCLPDDQLFYNSNHVFAAWIAALLTRPGGFDL